MEIFKYFPSFAVKKAQNLQGTPFYLYSANAFAQRFQNLKAALPDGWQLCFAAKANPNIAVIGAFRESGALVEAASAGEIMACLKAGYDPKQISLSGPVKTDAELSILKKKRISVIHVESSLELSQLDRIGIKQNVALRINPDFEMGKTSAGEIMVGGSEKFGFSVKDAITVLKRRKKLSGVNLVGFHIYMGTQIRSANNWLKGAASYLNCIRGIMAETGFVPEYINFGGGLGIPYREKDAEFDLNAFEKGLKKLQRRYDKDVSFGKTKFYIEPGRYLAGPAGVYVMKVVALKRIRNRSFVLTDGGIHHALFPFRVSRQFPVRLLNRKGEGRKVDYILGGPLCTTLDQSDMPVSLPELKPGDLLGVFNSGAYGYSASMQYFLSHPLPAEILLKDKKLFLIRKRSDSKHLFANQVETELS